MSSILSCVILTATVNKSSILFGHLNVFDDLLSITQQLSLQLQATKLDIGSCRRVLDGDVTTINKQQSDSGFGKVRDDTVKFANENNINIPSASVWFKSRLC